MLNPRVLFFALILVLGGCSGKYVLEPPKRELNARVAGNSVVLVNDLDVPVTLLSPTGKDQVELAAGATTEPLSFTVEKWKILQPGAADQIEIKDENPLLQPQMVDLVLLFKAKDAPRREAHLIVGPCFFDSASPSRRTVRISQFPLSGTRIPLCP